MGPESDKEQEIVGSFNSININSLPDINKEINANTIKESTKVHTSRPMETQQVQSISSTTPQNLEPNFTSSIPYDSSRIAEYILSTLPETPGEDDIFESFLKSREQTTTHDVEERYLGLGIVESSSSSHPMKNSGGQLSNNNYSSQITSEQQLINQRRSKIPPGYFGTSDPVIISDEDEDRNMRRVSKSVKHNNYNNSNSNEDEELYDGTQDHAWISEKERMVKLYSHKLHLRKPRMQDPNLCSHEIEFLSDFDDDDL